MTLAPLRERLAVLRWSQWGLAEAMACDDSLVRRWASGDGTVLAGVAAWLDRLATAQAAEPAPQDWLRRAAA